MKKKNVDEIDIVIINHLQNNANITNRALAKAVGLSPGPTLVRVQNLWKRRLFTFCRAQVNHAAFRFNLKAVVIVSVPEETSNRFTGNVKSTREVVTCYELSRKSPIVKSKRYLAIVIAKSVEDMEGIVESMCRGTKVQDISVVNVEKTHKESPLYITEADL